MELLTLVLTLNNFQFKGEDYLQVGGTAMGTRVAPSYANVFMSQFEEKHVYTYRLKPLARYRYIDDVFCIWQHGDIELNNFVAHLNNTHDTIKFSMETSKVEIGFLDTMVKGPSINYIRIFSRFLDPPTPPVAHSMHLNDPPPPLLRTSSQKSETPPFFPVLLRMKGKYFS